MIYMNKNDLHNNYVIQKFCTNCGKINKKNETFKCAYCGAEITYFRAISKDKNNKEDKFVLSRDIMKRIEGGASFYVDNQQAAIKEQMHDDEFDKFDKETSTNNSVTNTNESESYSEANKVEHTEDDNQSNSILEQSKSTLDSSNQSTSCSDDRENETPKLSEAGPNKNTSIKLEEENQELKMQIEQMQKILEKQAAIINNIIKSKEEKESVQEKSDLASNETYSKAVEPKYIPEVSFGEVTPAWLESTAKESNKEKDENLDIDEDKLRIKIREKVKKEFEEKKRLEEEERLREEYEKKMILLKEKEIEIEKDERAQTESMLKKNERQLVNVNDDGYYNSIEVKEDDTYKKSIRSILIKGVWLFILTSGLLYAILYIIQNIL